VWQLSESDTLQVVFYVHMHVGKEGLKRAGSPRWVTACQSSSLGMKEGKTRRFSKDKKLTEVDTIDGEEVVNFHVCDGHDTSTSETHYCCQKTRGGPRILKCKTHRVSVLYIYTWLRRSPSAPMSCEPAT